MTSFLAIVAAAPGVVAAALGLYLVTLAVASSLPSRVAPSAASRPASRIAVLVPAHNEELLVARCVRSLLEQTYPRAMYRVIVIADNCTDATAALAHAAGAEVWQRTDPFARGKGQALRWAMDLLLLRDEGLDAIVVVDADSIAAPDMLAALERRLAAGAEVVQADYELITAEPGDVRAALVGAAVMLFHRVRLAGRARLGMPSALVGNGMLFATRVLREHPWNAFSAVEDLEYTLRLRLAGIRPAFAVDAHVEGPGAASRAGMQQQRARWEGGRFSAMAAWFGPLVAAAIRKRDARLLDAALDLAVPPLALLALIAFAGAALTSAAALAGIVPAWAAVPWIVGVAAIPVFVVIGLAGSGRRGALRTVLLGAPAYVAWKVLAYARLARGFDPQQWTRSDRAGEGEAGEAATARATPRPAAGRVEVGGVPVDAIDMDSALSRLEQALDAGRLVQVSTVNLDFIVRAQRDPEVRRILRQTELNLADGAPVVWLGRLLGARLPDRVAGADLVPALMGRMAASRRRVFLLGGEDGVAEAAATRLLELHPELQVAGVYEPPRAPVEQIDSAAIIERIRAAEADILLVAFGHPKQERWIDLNRERLPVSVAIGVGCVFDLIAGRSRRAPRWMQAIGLEWAYRLAQEPRRLVGRYVTDIAWLVPITARAVYARLTSARSLEPA